MILSVRSSDFGKCDRARPSALVMDRSELKTALGKLLGRWHKQNGANSEARFFSVSEPSFGPSVIYRHEKHDIVRELE